MNNDLASAMGRATEAVRANDLATATTIIRQALSGRQTADTVPPQRRAGRIDPAVKDAITLDPQPPGRTDRPFRPRRRLGAVVDALRNLRGTTPSGHEFPLRAPAPMPDLPNGATFETHEFACPAGARRFRLYVPSCPIEDLRGLVLMLHGCKQDPEDFAAGTGMNGVGEAQHLLVVYPAQTSTANVAACWNWFDPAHQARETGEPAILAALTRRIAEDHDIPADKVFVAGLSAGGAMAAVLSKTHPELFSAVGIHSGLPFGSANDVVSAFAAMRGQHPAHPAPEGRDSHAPRTIVFHGTADATVAIANAERIVRNGSLGSDDRQRYRKHLIEGGRACTRTNVQSPEGATALEYWRIDGAGHAWSGGDPAGSYTDATGPNASAEMVRFFLDDARKDL